MLGGLGIALVCVALDPVLPGFLVILLAIGGAAAFGAAWALIPGYLQAYRGSHIVITTIMFNFIASGLMVWLLSGMMMSSGQGSPQTRAFAETAWLPRVHDALGWVGIETTSSPLNLSFIIAILACITILMLLHTRHRLLFGLHVRAFVQRRRRRHRHLCCTPRCLWLEFGFVLAAVSVVCAGDTLPTPTKNADKILTGQRTQKEC